MFEKVLVPTDFSKYAYEIVDCITQIPGLKEIVLLYVADLSRPSLSKDKAMEDAQVRLNGQEKYLKSQSIKVKARLEIIREGSVASAIQRVADEEKANLIAMSSRGKSLIGSIFLGNVSLDTLRYGTSDLLIIHYKNIDDQLQLLCPQLFSRVLYATDFSDPSMAVLYKIKSMQGLKSVDLINVVSGGESNEEIDAKIHEAVNTLHTLGDSLRKDGFDVRVHVPVGNPTEAIRDVANRMNDSLIVIGSTGKSKSKQSLGSTAFDVTRTSDRPVLVFRV
jgi:nucleotide-binding universal stress UspA family protein